MSDLVLPPGVAAAFAAQDAVEAEQERRSRIERDIARQDADEARARDDAMFETWHGYSREELRQHMLSRPDSARDPAAEPGSERNPQVVLGGVPLVPGGPEPRRSATAGTAAVIARSRAASQDPFMARLVGEYDRRQEVTRTARWERARTRQAEIDRLTAAGVSPAEAELAAYRGISR